MRQRGFESHLVLWTPATARRMIFDNRNGSSAHDVTAAYCLAMAEVRVQLPLGALHPPSIAEQWNGRMWESLGIRVPRAHEIVGSNPTVLTAASAALCLRQQVSLRNDHAGATRNRVPTLPRHAMQTPGLHAVGPVLVREGGC
jgi:hypothetical protein